MSDSLVRWLTLILLPSGLSQCTEHLSQSPTTLELQEPGSYSALPAPSVSHGELWIFLPTSTRNLGVGTSYWDSLKDGGMEGWPHFPEPSLLIHRKTLVFLSRKLLFTLLMVIHFSFLLLFLANTNIFEFFRLLMLWSWTEKETSHKHHLGYKAPHYCHAVLTFKNDVLVSVFNGSFDSVGVENLLACILACRLNPRGGIRGLQTDLLGIQGCQVVGSFVRITQSVKKCYASTHSKWGALVWFLGV